LSVFSCGASHDAYVTSGFMSQYLCGKYRNKIRRRGKRGERERREDVGIELSFQITAAASSTSLP